MNDAERAATHGTTLTKTDLVAAMQLFSEELQKQLAEGKTVKTGVGSFYLSASGCMDSEDESFLPDNPGSSHGLRLHFRPDRDFEAGARTKARVQRDDVVDRTSPLVRVAQSTVLGKASVAVAGDVLRLRGARLKFDLANPAEGVFFILAGSVASGGASGGASAATETRASLYPTVTPSAVHLMVPATVSPGVYTIALRTLGGGKVLREGRLEGVTVCPQVERST